MKGPRRRARRLYFDHPEPPEECRAVAVQLFEIVQNGNLDTIVKEVTRSISELTGIVGCAVVLIDHETRSPTFAGGMALSANILAAMEAVRRRRASVTWWHAYTKNRIVLERNWRQRALTDPKLASMRPYAAQQQDLDDLVALPLQTDGPPIGVAVGMLPPGVTVHQETYDRWRRTAFEAALALQYAVAIRNARHAGTDHERLRMREELHETVSQRLFGVSMLAARAEADAKTMGHPTLGTQLQELRGLVAEASSEIRRLIGDPEQIVDSGTLSSRLGAVAEHFAEPYGLDIDLAVDPGWDDLNQECTDDVIRIVRECLRNVVKHARATRVSVRLPPAVDGMLLVDVSDNGTGFDPQAIGQTSFGLSLISERALERGGTCEVHVSGEGTTMRVRLVPEFESEWQLARRALDAQTRGGAHP